MLEFLKMHGCGNDFVVLDFRKEEYLLKPEQIKAMCDRHFGIGCDQLVVLNISYEADIRARFYNADGSESGACGNASRCVAHLYMKERDIDVCTIETGGGILKASYAGEEMISIDMGAPKLDWQSIPLAEETDTNMVYIKDGAFNPAVCVNMGNPHTVLFVDDVENALVDRIGPAIETAPKFPERTNVEFVQVLEGGRLRQRTWERGAGETLACGSGACAVAVAAIQRDLIDGRHATVELNGGTLEIEWRAADNHVIMTGPVKLVYKGVLNGAIEL